MLIVNRKDVKLFINKLQQKSIMNPTSTNNIKILLKILFSSKFKKRIVIENIVVAAWWYFNSILFALNNTRKLSISNIKLISINKETGKWYFR
jgi:hypothetical protein